MRAKISPPTRSRRVLVSLILFLVIALYFLIRGNTSPLPLSPTTTHTNDTDTGLIRSSIVIPAYHEKDNIRPLVTRIFKSLRDPSSAEVVIVDDNSRDGTDLEVDSLREESYNVVLIVRTGPNEKGLSSAVIRGIHEARGDSIVVMDADLQHPPETVQAFLDALDNPKTPIALGTRYGEGVAMDANWPVSRRIISWGARSLARPLTSASDPMTGFFGIKKPYVMASAPLNPTGFKIALELLLKAPLPKNGIAEIPFDFGTRSIGESKLSSKVMLRYVAQLISLYWWSWGVFFPLVILVLGGVAVGVLVFGVRLLRRKKEIAERRRKRRSVEPFSKRISTRIDIK